MTTSSPSLPPTPDATIDGGDLDCGSGLLLMIRGAMAPLQGGGVLEIRSREISVCEDLPAWCRMVGHSLVAEVPGTNKYTHYFVRKKADATSNASEVADTTNSNLNADAEYEAHLTKARAYQWKVRAKATDGMNVRVFARNHQIDAGQPASFNTEDQHPGAIEYLLTSLASCILSGFVWRLTQAGWRVSNAEATLSAKPNNILVFLGIENEGSPALESITGKVFLAADHDSPPDDSNTEIQTMFAETIRRSPIAQTLARATRMDISCTLVE